MADDKEKILQNLEARTTLLKLVLEDEDVRNRFEALLQKEIDFEGYLLSLEHKKIPERDRQTYGEIIIKKLKTSWKDWVAKIFEKFNSMLTSIIPIGGGQKK